ncbi:MAG: YraN family protein [Gammaproteobacteria bacterium]
MKRHRDGEAWENAARGYLSSFGLDILKQRYRCRLGELDLVCREASMLVIVEVRSRKRGAQVSAVDSIDRHKQRKIILATRHLLMSHPAWDAYTLRFDVLTIDDSDTPAPRVRWWRDAFRAD